MDALGSVRDRECLDSVHITSQPDRLSPKQQPSDLVKYEAVEEG